MSLSREAIESALQKLGNPEESQRANETLLKWMDTPGGIVQAIQIITESTNDSLIFQAANVAKVFIDQKWMQYPASDHTHVRNSLCEKLVSYHGPQFVRRALIDLVVAVALKDWPDEWPDCLENFINSTQSSLEMCVLDFEVIASLIAAIHESSTITNLRRKNLIDMVNGSTKLLLDCIEWAVSTLDQAVVGVSLCKLMEQLCLTAPPELLLRPGMLDYLVTTLVPREDTSVSATGAVANLLVRRPDAHDFVPGMLDEVVQLLAKIVNENVPPHFLLVIMQFLRQFGGDIEESCYHDDEPDQELVNWVLSVYRLILTRSASSDEYCEDFWMLWRNILVRYARVVKSTNKFDALQPCFLLFRELIPEIRDSLYFSFPSAADSGKLRSVDCQTCWICLASADKEGMMEFLKTKVGQPSPALCFAIGLLDCCLTGQEEYALLEAVLPILFKYNQELTAKKATNPSPLEFGTALLYTLSHSVRFLNRRQEILAAFGQCLITFLNSPEPVVQSSAANALLYISNRQASLLFRQDAPICTALIDNVNTWVSNMPIKTSAKIIKAIARMASETKNAEERATFYENSFGPVISMLTSGSDETIEDGLKVVNDLTKMKLTESQGPFFKVMESLYSLFEQVAQNQNEIVLAQVVDTMTSVLCVFEFEPVKNIIDGFAGKLLELPVRDIALLTFSRLRQHFVQMDVFYEKIYVAQIEPILPTLRDTQFEALGVLRFFRRFRKEPAVLSVVSEVAIHFVRDERLDVSKESAKLLRSLFNYLYEERQFGYVVEGRVNILTALFQTLTDNLHRKILKSVAKALDAFFLCVTNSTLAPAKLDEDVVRILSNVTDNKEMLGNFAGFLRGFYSDFPKFLNALHEFLVALKCASVSDSKLFRREIEMDAMEQLLNSFVVSEEKSAIKAEEVESVPELKDLAAELAALH